MADIELVIKIPKEQYRTLNAKSQNDVVAAIDNALLIEAIKNGTPLPKGHGRLIDVSDIEWAKHREERNYIDYEVIDWDNIVNASTIIEADKVGAEG